MAQENLETAWTAWANGSHAQLWGQAHPTRIPQWDTHLLFRHGVKVLVVRAEDQVTQDGAALLGHHTLIGQGWPAARGCQVHQDLWQPGSEWGRVSVFLSQPHPA